MNHTMEAGHVPDQHQQVQNQDQHQNQNEQQQLQNQDQHLNQNQQYQHVQYQIQDVTPHQQLEHQNPQMNQHQHQQHLQYPQHQQQYQYEQQLKKHQEYQNYLKHYHQHMQKLQHQEFLHQYHQQQFNVHPERLAKGTYFRELASLLGIRKGKPKIRKTKNHSILGQFNPMVAWLKQRRKPGDRVSPGTAMSIMAGGASTAFSTLWELLELIIGSIGLFLYLIYSVVSVPLGIFSNAAYEDGRALLS
jgi:hypothetical protein